MVRLPPKKGPRMTSGVQGKDKTQDFGRDEMETQLDAFAIKVHTAIEDARSKMSPERRAEADKKAEAIFEKASVSAKSARRSA